jgi:L-2-hydroxyglutarate oxidase LhgO
MTSADCVDAVVIGAGVVGLAAGRALARAGLETIVLERHRRIGEEASSRNSGVIHSGIYYPPGSLKARLCVRGKEMLYAYCEERGIRHARCGKLLVAQGPEIPVLEALHARGRANGVADLARLDPAEVRELEPEVRCAAALLSPSTGILDVHELMTALLGDLEAAGGMLVLDTEVERLRRGPDGLELTINSGGATDTFTAQRVVASAGLQAVPLTHRIEGYPAARIPRGYLAKGNYFSCSARPFRRLVYPMPGEAGLGVHATLDLDGSLRFGPDVEWVENVDYAVDPGRAAPFYAAIREYWPDLPAGSLQPAYAGVRSKVAGPGEAAKDFVMAGPAEHGIAGLVNLLGIESPGLTAALAIADHVTDRELNLNA